MEDTNSHHPNFGILINLYAWFMRKTRSQKQSLSPIPDFHNDTSPASFHYLPSSLNIFPGCLGSNTHSGFAIVRGCCIHAYIYPLLPHSERDLHRDKPREKTTRRPPSRAHPFGLASLLLLSSSCQCIVLRTYL
jgi:hypothetical protein